MGNKATGWECGDNKYGRGSRGPGVCCFAVPEGRSALHRLAHPHSSRAGKMPNQAWSQQKTDSIVSQFAGVSRTKPFIDPRLKQAQQRCNGLAEKQASDRALASLHTRRAGFPSSLGRPPVSDHFLSKAFPSFCQPTVPRLRHEWAKRPSFRPECDGLIGATSQWPAVWRPCHAHYSSLVVAGTALWELHAINTWYAAS